MFFFTYLSIYNFNFPQFELRSFFVQAYRPSSALSIEEQSRQLSVESLKKDTAKSSVQTPAKLPQVLTNASIIADDLFSPEASSTKLISVK